MSTPRAKMTKEGHKPKTVFTTSSIQRHERNGWEITELHDPQDRLGKGAAQPKPQTNGNGVSVPEHATDTAQPPAKSAKKGKGK